MATVDLDVSVYGITSFPLVLPTTTTVAEVMDCVSKKTTIPVADIRMEVVNKNASNDFIRNDKTTLGELEMRDGKIWLGLRSPTIECLRIANRLKSVGFPEPEAPKPDLIVKIYTPFVGLQLGMTKFDTVSDAKQLVAEMIGCDSSVVVFKCGVPMMEPKDDALVGTLSYKGVVKFFEVSTSPDVKDKLIALRKVQDELREGGEKLITREGLSISLDFISFTSHKLQEFEATTPVASQPKSNDKDEKTTTEAFEMPQALNDKKEMMAKLLSENSEMEARIKDNKKKVVTLRGAIRSSPIKVWLLRPNGEKFDITAQADFTVAKLKRSIDSVYGFMDCFQRLISNDAISGAPVEMKNNKRLYSYNIQNDGDEIFFVMTGGNQIPTPVADEEPVVNEGEGYDATPLPMASLSSADEDDDEAGTPWMSDDDVPPLPAPNPEDMAVVSVKDFTNKEHVRFFGKVDVSQTLSAFLDYILTFEDLTEEQVETLRFSNERGIPYDSNITIRQAMASDGFSCFYIKVKGLLGGVKTIRTGAQLKVEKNRKKIEERNKLWAETSAKVSAKCRVIDCVKTVEENIASYVKALPASTNEAVLTEHLVNLLKKRPVDFDYILNHLETSGAGSWEVKLKHIALRFFDGMEVEKMGDDLKNVKISAECVLTNAIETIALNYAEKGKLFEMSDLVSKMEAMKSVATAGATSAGDANMG
eukprot:s4353_g6.t1